MSELQERRGDTLIVRQDQMLYAIPSDDHQDEEILYVVDEQQGSGSRDVGGGGRVKLAGIWSHLDADDMLETLERWGQESPPTPPITSID